MPVTTATLYVAFPVIPAKFPDVVLTARSALLSVIVSVGCAVVFVKVSVTLFEVPSSVTVSPAPMLMSPDIDWSDVNLVSPGLVPQVMFFHVQVAPLTMCSPSSLIDPVAV
ncbi:Uncharacterised protein [uncultured archaeon]|nr:Uncharacterised protein [uncultured archaeon]